MIIKPGQTVTFTHYGAPHRGVVETRSLCGNILHVRDDNGRRRWLHRDSVAAA